MKKQLFLFSLSLFIVLQLNAQTNTFPTSGNVGIGTTTPAAHLEIKSSWGNWISLKDSYNNDVYGFHNPNNGGRLELYIHDGLTNKNSFGVFTIRKSGNIGIGTTIPDSKLTVAGNIHAQEVKVTISAGADFVFNEDYQLRPLEEVAQFIKENKHLPEIDSEKVMQENGLHLAEMNIKLLQKIEELTLYTIRQEKQLKKQAIDNQELKERLLKLEELIFKITQ